MTQCLIWIVTFRRRQVLLFDFGLSTSCLIVLLLNHCPFLINHCPFLITYLSELCRIHSAIAYYYFLFYSLEKIAFRKPPNVNKLVPEFFTKFPQKCDCSWFCTVLFSKFFKSLIGVEWDFCGGI